MAAPQLDRPRKPIWVRLALLGVSGRRSARASCAISWILGIAIGLGGFWDRRLLAGFLLLIAAVGYWQAIRWMDRNGGW